MGEPARLRQGEFWAVSAPRTRGGRGQSGDAGRRDHVGPTYARRPGLPFHNASNQESRPHVREEAGA